MNGAKSLDDVEKMLSSWRQGDCVVDNSTFIFETDPNLPASEASNQVEQSGPYVAEDVRGLAVLTQTCDLIRHPKLRPYVEVAPLVEATEGQMHEIRARRRPQYVLVPNLQDQRLVVDLDRVMTVEKPVVSRWKRVSGCKTEVEVREFAAALARKRVRAAFAEEFVIALTRFQERLSDKHGKQSDEGRAVRSFFQIRVHARMGWASEPAEIQFWFIVDPAADMKPDELEGFVKKWIALIKPNKLYVYSYRIVGMGDISAAEYVASDQLDYDHLS